jgi:hypothetical protein
MFHETVTHASGDSGAASEAHALFLLRRAIRQGDSVEVTPAGGAIVRRTRTDRGGVKVKRSIVLNPHLLR